MIQCKLLWKDFCQIIPEFLLYIFLRRVLLRRTIFTIQDTLWKWCCPLQTNWNWEESNNAGWKTYISFRWASSEGSFRLHSEVFLNSCECMQLYQIQLKLVNHLGKKNNIKRDLFPPPHSLLPLELPISKGTAEISVVPQSREGSI